MATGFAHKKTTLMVPSLLLMTICMQLGTGKAFPSTSETLSGSVTYKGQSVDGAEIMIKKSEPYNEGYYSQHKTLAKALSDSNGKFSVAVPRGYYSIFVLRDSLGKSIDSAKTQNNPISIELHPIATIHGKLVCPENPSALPGAEIKFIGAGSYGIPIFEDQPLSSGANGSFTVHLDLTGRPSEGYRFRSAFAVETKYGHVGLSSHLERYLRASDLSNVELQIPLKRLIRGTVEIKDQTGSPMSDLNWSMNVKADLGGRVDLEWGPFQVSGKTDTNGLIHFKNAWPGRNYLLFNGPTYIEMREIDLSKMKDDDRLTTAVESVYHEKWSGKVTNEKGEAMSDVLIELRYLYFSSSIPLYGKTNTDGAYAISEMPTKPWGIYVYKPGYFPGSRFNEETISPGSYNFTMRKRPGLNEQPISGTMEKKESIQDLPEKEYQHIMKSLESK